MSSRLQRAFPHWWVVCLAGLFASSAVGATIDVPGDQPTLAAALTAAAAGDVIYLHGGTHPPITITKPVTIVGSPGTRIDNTGVGSGAQDPNVTLGGAGAGRVALVDVDLVGKAELGFMFSGMGSRIVGGGFAELLIEDCVVAAPEGFNPSGAYQSRPAVTVTVPTVFVSRCEITGAAGGTDGCYHPHPSVSSFIGDSGAAVRAPGSTVVVLDSVLRGGVGPDLCFDLSTSAPANAADIPSGGSGVVCATLFRANCLIQGGAGLDVLVQNALGSFTSIGQGPAGSAVAAGAVVNLDTKIDAPSFPVLGGTWTMSWATTSDPTRFIAGQLAPPLPVFGHGHWFFKAGTSVQIPFPSGSHAATFPVTFNPALIGLTVVVQLHEPNGGLTRPIVVTHR